MISLKDLILDQKILGLSDIEVIKRYFVLNDLEVEGLDIIEELTKSKIEKLKQQQDVAKTWVNSLPSTYLYENYDLKTANMLHNLELNYLVNNKTLTDNYLNWAKENIPNIKRPQVYFNPLVDYLEKNGVYFKK